VKEDQASITAYTVLQGVLFTATKPGFEALVEESTRKACRKVLSASAEGQKRLRQLDSTLFRTLAPMMEKAILPGITLHYVLRKRYIRDAAEKAIAEGFTQIVNLGAGFDTLTWELHSQYPDVNFIELDHPATSAQKQKILTDGASDNLHLLEVDFSKTDAKAALNEFTGFDARRNTFYICEGVLMYLDITDVERLFKGLKELTNTRTRFVFSCVAPMSSKETNCGWLLKLYLMIKSEPLNWEIEQQGVEAFVDAQGYQLTDLAGTDQLKARYLKGMNHGTLHRGEYLVQTDVIRDAAGESQDAH